MTKQRSGRWAIYALPPPTLDTGRWVTATYPPAAGTVVSVQPSGAVRLAPAGTEGPGEWAVLNPDRLVYAPEGAAGAVFLLPYAGDDVPNA
jgi:hypothetical protein